MAGAPLIRFITFLFFPLPAFLASEPSPCESTLDQLQELYNQGQLDQLTTNRVISREPEGLVGYRLMLAEFASCYPSERARIYAILAEAAFYAHGEAAATAVLSELFELDPAFDFQSAREAGFRRFALRTGALINQSLIQSVTGSGIPLRLTPATVYVIDREKIRMRGYRDLVELIEDIPGFDVARTGGDEYASIQVRGLRLESNTSFLIRVDGVEQNDLLGTNALISRQYPMGAIDRVVAVLGPISSLYGPNAFLGILDIFTKNTIRDQTKMVEMEISADSGSMGTTSAEARVFGKFGDKLNWDLSLRDFSSDEYDLSKQAAWDFANPAQAGDAFRESAKNRFLQFRVLIDNTTFGIQNWEIEEGNASAFTDQFLASGDRNQFAAKHSTFYLRRSGPISTHVNSQIKLEYSEHQLPSQGNLIQQFWPVEGEEHSRTRISRGYGMSASEFRFESSLSFRMERSTWLLGGEWRSRSLETGLTHFNESGVEVNYLESPSFLGVHDQSLSIHDLGGFVHWSQTIHPTMRIDVSLRYQKSQTLDHPELNDSDHLSPRIALTMEHLESWILKFVGSNGYRSPAIYESVAAYRYPQSLELALGTPTTRTVNSLDLIADYQGEHYSALLTLYRQESHQVLTEYEQGSNSDKTRYSARAQMTGLSAQLTGKPLGPKVQFSCDLDLKFSKGESQSSGVWVLGFEHLYLANGAYQPDPFVVGSVEQPSRRMADIPRWKLGLSADAQLNNRLSLSLRTRHVATRPVGPNTTNWQNPEQPDAYAGQGEAIEAGAYSRMDLSARYSSPWPSERLGRIDLSLDIRNLLDESYNDPGARQADGFFFARAVPQPGTTFYLGLSYGF